VPPGEVYIRSPGGVTAKVTAQHVHSHISLPLLTHFGWSVFTYTKMQDSHSKEAVTVTVSEQRGSEAASKKSESPENKAAASTKSSTTDATEAPKEDISRLLLQVQELLMERLPKDDDVDEDGEALTAEDVATYAKVRAFLLGRRRGSLGSLIERLEEAVEVLADARDDIDDYLEAIELEQDRGRSSRRRFTRR
jgi:hypothetical protein